MKISSLTEEEVIALFIKNAISMPRIGEYLYYPEDARDILPRAPRIMFSIDAYSIESLRLPWRDYSDIAWSAFTGAVSDVVSKGAVPHASMIAIGLNPDLDVDVLRGLVNGLIDASRFYDVRILGGDTNKSLDTWIAISVLGFTTSSISPSRSGLRRGDYVVVTGVYGAMGYVIKHGFEKSISEKWVVEYTKRPVSEIRLAHIIENHYKAVSASMDVSDGLGYTMELMSKLSKYGIVIDRPPRTHEHLIELCRNDEKCILEYTLIGGEEYGVVLGIRPQFIEVIGKDLDHFNIPYVIIGRVVETEPGLYFKGERIFTKRYDQFKGWT